MILSSLINLYSFPGFSDITLSSFFTSQIKLLQFSNIVVGTISCAQQHTPFCNINSTASFFFILIKSKEEDPQISYQGLLCSWITLRVNCWHKCINSNSVNLKHKKTEENSQIHHNQTTENQMRKITWKQPENKACYKERNNHRNNSKHLIRNHEN